MAAAPVVDETERAARLFAESLRAHEAADRAAQQREQEAADRAARHVALQEARRSAAERIKRLRAGEGRRELIAEAEAAYRVALAELTEFETGERPHWAPAAEAPATEPPEDERPAAEPATSDEE